MLDLQAFFRDLVKSVIFFLFLRLISAVKIYNHFIKILERRQHENCMKCLQKWFYRHFVKSVNGPDFPVREQIGVKTLL